MVGFTAAGLLWAVFACVRPISDAMKPPGTTDADKAAAALPCLVAVGAFAQATRGFAPEAANLWALESFPTEERASAYAILSVVYQTIATAVVPATSSLQDADAVLLLVFYACIQLLLGVFTHFLPKETALHALDESAELDPLMRPKGLLR